LGIPEDNKLYLRGGQSIRKKIKNRCLQNCSLMTSRTTKGSSFFKTGEGGLITALDAHLISRVFILQYEDDTILFLLDDLEQNKKNQIQHTKVLAQRWRFASWQHICKVKIVEVVSYIGKSWI
jgi:hypothetical protein